MHEVPRLMPAIHEIFALDLNRLARTPRVFKIGIECGLVISIEAFVFIKNKYRTFKNYLTQNSRLPLSLEDLPDQSA